MRFRVLSPRIRNDDDSREDVGVDGSMDVVVCTDMVSFAGLQPQGLFSIEDRLTADQITMGAYLADFHAAETSAILTISGSLIADGVRENRGAGAGCVTPWRSTKTFRAAMCG